MDPREKNKWNRTFANCWRALQEADPNPRKVILDSDLAVAARTFRDKGQSPVNTAKGLYIGTRDAAARDLRLRGQR